MSALTNIEIRPMLDAGDDWKLAKNWIDRKIESGRIAPDALKYFSGVNALFAFAEGEDLAAGSLQSLEEQPGLEISNLITRPDLTAEEAKGAMHAVILGLYALAQKYQLPVLGLRASNALDSGYLKEVREKAFAEFAKTFFEPAKNAQKILRPYDPKADYQLVLEWWGHDNFVPPSRLTDFGVFALSDDQEVACGWLHVDNRSPIARLENIVLNPAYQGDNEPLAHLMTFFHQEAAKIGKTCAVDLPFLGSSLPDPYRDPIEFLDRCRAAMAGLPEENCEVSHSFTPGLYTRQIFIPAGTLCLSRAYKMEHPYVLSKGEISVWTPEKCSNRLRPPHSGITFPETQRLFFAHEDSILMSFHAGPWATVEEFEANIT